MKTVIAIMISLVVVVLGISSAAYLFGQAATPVTPATPHIPVVAATPAVAVTPPAASNSSEIPDEEVFKTQIQLFQVKHVNAIDLAEQLMQLMPKRPITSDGRTNQVIVNANKTDMEEIKKLIKQLDVAQPNNPQPTYPSGGYGGRTLPAADAQPNAYSAAIQEVNKIAAELQTAAESGDKDKVGRLQNELHKAANNVSTLAGKNIGVVTGSLRINANADVNKAWQDYAALTENQDVQNEVLDLQKQVEQAKASGNADTAKKLQDHIEHLLSEQARRIKEQTRRISEQASRAADQLKKAYELDNQQQIHSAEQARLDAEQAHRVAEQARRAVESVQRAIKIDAEVIQPESYIQKLADQCKQLSAIQNPTEEQQRDLESHKAQLRRFLEEQWKARRTMESQELIRLRERLDKLEQEMADRNNHAQDQINRRLEKLLSPRSNDELDTGNQSGTNDSSADQHGILVFTDPNGAVHTLVGKALTKAEAKLVGTTVTSSLVSPASVITADSGTITLTAPEITVQPADAVPVPSTPAPAPTGHR